MNFIKGLINFLLITALVVLVFYGVWGLKNNRQLLILGNTNAQTNDGNLNKNELNILFLGITGNDSYGANLTDTIFLIHINAQSKKAYLIGIPRDLWVKADGYNTNIKINGLYDLENSDKKKKTKTFELIESEVSQITGLNIDNTIVMELDGFRYLVDAIGGINIWLEEDVVDPSLKNPDNPNQIFKLEKGWRYLDGKTAAKFIRTRYAPEGDFYRMEHQQQIIAAIKNKLSGMLNLWGMPKLIKIYQGLGQYINTDIGMDSVMKLIKFAKYLNEENTKYVILSNRPPSEALISTTVPSIDPEGKSVNAYILLPKLGFEKYEGIQQYLQEQFK